jgi:hypothetical protein
MAFFVPFQKVSPDLQEVPMYRKKHILVLASMIIVLSVPGIGAGKKRDKAATSEGEITSSAAPVLWREPTDIASRNLLYGPGGKEHAPPSTFTFESEDMNGSNPKLVIRDDRGVKWKLKLGAEAHPEPVAANLVWAVGYFANEDYFLPEVQIKNLPAHLRRGQELVGPNGTLHDVRVKRYLKGEKKTGIWEWRHNPYTGTREFNGLRVMMAVINNWDLKDENNAIYREKRGEGEPQELVYMISDLGASFGTTNLLRNHEKAKGNLDSYAKSKFIRKVDGQFVDFDDPHRPSTIVFFNPHEYVSRVNLEWIGKHIPVADAKWMGEQLGKLSPEQIRDAFRAGGYSPDEVEGFASVLESRIQDLKRL